MGLILKQVISTAGQGTHMHNNWLVSFRILVQPSTWCGFGLDMAIMYPDPVGNCAHDFSFNHCRTTNKVGSRHDEFLFHDLATTARMRQSLSCATRTTALVTSRCAVPTTLSLLAARTLLTLTPQLLVPIQCLLGQFSLVSSSDP